MTTIVKGGDYIIEGYPRSVVRILADDLGGNSPVVYVAKYDEAEPNWLVFRCDVTGYGHNRLIPRPPRTVKRKVWINWYEHGPHIFYLDKEEANNFASPLRIACTEHELDVPEGVKL